MLISMVLVLDDFFDSAGNESIVVLIGLFGIFLEHFAGQISIETSFAKGWDDCFPVDVAIGDVSPDTAGVYAAIAFIILDVNVVDAAVKDLDPALGPGEGNDIAVLWDFRNSMQPLRSSSSGILG